MATYNFVHKTKRKKTDQNEKEKNRPKESQNKILIAFNKLLMFHLRKLPFKYALTCSRFLNCSNFIYERFSSLNIFDRVLHSAGR